MPGSSRNARAGNATAEAAAWLARLHADTCTAADERAFRAWLAADPAHAEAFDRVTSVWDAAGALCADPLARSPQTLRPGRRAFLAAGGALAASVAAGAAWQAAWAGVYETQVGEQKRVPLPDGSQMVLDTDTRLRVHFSERLRAVTLGRGRANFRVARDERRPFLVEAADQRIVVRQASFDVRRDGAKVSLLVLRGQAIVTAAGEAAPTPEAVQPGGRLTSSPMEPVHLDRPDLAPLVAWQNGQAVFAGETLSQATTEMNRYSAEKLLITDDHVAALRISGVYHVGDNDAFARSVALLLPVDVLEVDGHILLSPVPNRVRSAGG